MTNLSLIGSKRDFDIDIVSEIYEIYKEPSQNSPRI